MKRMLAWLLAVCVLMSACAAMAEGATPTDLDVPVVPAWDESACDHMNAQCEQAPRCGMDGCAHVICDVHGLDVPLCVTGQWMLAQMNAAGMSASADIDLDNGNAVIYRAGTYSVMGGTRTGADISVATTARVCLKLRKAAMQTLSVCENGVVSIETEDVNTIAMLTAGENAAVTFAGSGAVRIDGVSLTERKCATFEVRSGSVQASFEERNGRTVSAYSMNGAATVAVNGRAYPACGDENGMVWLWLNAPETGMQWQAETVDGALNIAQVAIATEVPATEVPVTEAPVTEAPVTEAPVTEAPATEVPVTEAPATEVPATEAPATEAPWDESQCDHVTLMCESAPKCEVPECEHIGQDANELDIPLCEAGKWLLDQAEMYGIALYSVRAIPIDLSLGDAVIWRSGSYTVRDGKGKLTVAERRMVMLTLENAAISDLILGEGSATAVLTEGVCSIDTVTAGENAQLGLGGAGHVTIASPVAAPVAVASGSVKAVLTEAEGRQPKVFQVGKCVSVVAESADVEATPDTEGNAYLWLPAAAEGMEWTARVEGNRLVVEQSAMVPEGEAVAVESGSGTVAAEGRVYQMTGSMDDTALIVDVPGVTVILDGVEHAGDTLVRASVPYTLIVKNASSVASLTNAKVVAEALLMVSGQAEGTTFASGCVLLNVTPAGYEAYALSEAAAPAALVMDGESKALVMNAEGKLLLPVAAENEVYLLDVQGDTVVVETLKHAYTLSGETALDLGADTGMTLTGSGKGTVSLKGGSEAEMAFVRARLEGVVQLTEEKLTIVVRGVNELKNETDAIVLAGDSAVTVKTLDGCLTLHQQNLTGVALNGNIRVLPEVADSHLCVVVRDAQGNVAANQVVQVKLGEQTLSCTTFEDGTLHLWGLGDVSGKELAVTDGEKVYTAVIAGTSAEATTGLTIGNVVCMDMPDGTVQISVTCDGAKSGGVQVRCDAADMPDTFDAQAQRVALTNGQAVLAGLEPGQAVTLRVYVSSQEGVSLTADNADGFQFSELIAHVHRAPFPVDQSENATVTYNGKPYENPLKLPEDARVTYSGDHLNEYGKPVRVGKYVMHVTIPETSVNYIPGVYDISFAVEKIPLHVIPESNQEKYEGDPDPEEYPFTVEGLLYYDDIGGVLIREAGEEPGNYRFLTKELVLKEYYDPIIYGTDAVFTILPAPPASWGGMMGETLKPIRQTIEKKDGRKVYVMLNTAGNLRVSGTDYGCVVHSSETTNAKNVRPSLSWNEKENKLLLRLRTEPDVNKDGGYATGPDGKVIWTGRYLRITYDALDMLYKKGIDAISLSVKDAALTVNMEELFSDEVRSYVKTLTATPGNAYIRMEIIPVADVPEEIAALSPVTDGWTMAVSVQIVHTCYDITAMLPGTTMQVDLEPVAELLKSVNVYNDETFSGDHTLAVITSAGENWPVQAPLVDLPEVDDALEAAYPAERYPLPRIAAALEAKAPVYVKPFAEDEMDRAAYANLLYTHRYLTLPVPEALTVWCVRAPKPVEEATEETMEGAV